VDVTALGSVRPRRILCRQGARPGDHVYVTGSLGAAAIGLRLLRTAADNATGPVDATVWTSAPERYLQPEPRVRAGQLLGRNRAASSCMDLSDGLADGLHQIARASGVGMSIDASLIPHDADVRRWHETHGGNPIDTLFAGGDDYELLFTARPSHGGRLRTVTRQLGTLSVTRIGVVTKDTALVVTTGDGTRPLPRGYEHYR
jgi:thiamine-monophosphate kinase